VLSASTPGRHIFCKIHAAILVSPEATTVQFDRAFVDVRAATERRGVRVRQRPLRRDLVGIFDGVSVTLNSDYGPEELTYYLAHALGSMARWSLSRDAVQAMFDELRDAKDDRADAARLERAIAAYRSFETESSEFAVWLLDDLGHGAVVPPYTNFMRADLEAMTEYHRTGTAPVWEDFFARWNESVAAGLKIIPAFRPKPLPAFAPVRIENQEILQKHAGCT
jgi:hypothetical protein